MKVVLLRDVSGVGQRGTVQEVADGYALNRLIPQRMAVVATPASLAELKRQSLEKDAALEAEERRWSERARLLKDAKITVRVEANEKGHLYQQLSADIISERVRKELGVDISAAEIATKEPIRSLGRADVHIQSGKRKLPLVVFVERKT